MRAGGHRRVAALQQVAQAEGRRSAPRTPTHARAEVPLESVEQERTLQLLADTAGHDRDHGQQCRVGRAAAGERLERVDRPRCAAAVSARASSAAGRSPMRNTSGTWSDAGQGLARRSAAGRARAPTAARRASGCRTPSGRPGRPCRAARARPRSRAESWPSAFTAGPAADGAGPSRSQAGSGRSSRWPSRPSPRTSTSSRRRTRGGLENRRAGVSSAGAAVTGSASAGRISEVGSGSDTGVLSSMVRPA